MSSMNKSAAALWLIMPLAMLSACAAKPLVVRPAAPVLPVCLIIPARLLTDKPTVILPPSPSGPSMPSPKRNCRTVSEVTTSGD